MVSLQIFLNAVIPKDFEISTHVEDALTKQSYKENPTCFVWAVPPWKNSYKNRFLQLFHKSFLLLKIHTEIEEYQNLCKIEALQIWILKCRINGFIGVKA